MAIEPTIVSLIEAVAQNYADRTVARAGARELSYFNWVSAARTLAKQLVAMGAAHQRIAVCMPNSIEFLIAVLAIWMSGAVCVPISSTLLAEPEKLAQLLGHIKPLVTMVSSVDSSEPPSGDRAISANAGVVVEIRENGHFIHVSPDASHPAADADDFRLGEPHDAEDILILYSSGTTATPKGAIHTCDSVLHHVRQHISLMGYGPEDCSLVCMQMDRAFCLTSQILPAVLSGASLLIHKEFHPIDVALALASEGVSLIYGYPDYFHKLVLEAADERRNTLRAGVAGGEMCTKATILAFHAKFSAPLVQSVGMIETLAYSLNTSSDSAKIGAAGQAINGIDILIESDSGDGLGGGHGEIVVQSPSLMKGYLGFAPAGKGSLRTGDAGYMDDDGYLWLHGKIPLGPNFRRRHAIREELYGCSLVYEAAVIDVKPAGNLVAYVVPRKLVELKEIMKSLKAETVSECQFIQVPALPRLPSGKVDNAALQLIARSASEA